MSIIQNFFQTSDLFFNIDSNKENLDLRTEIGDDLYDADYVKRVIIPSEVTVGSATTTGAALKIPNGLGGKLLIDNYGSIQGAGGSAGGGDGGDAIVVESVCEINNKPTGTIYAGGGGGGGGGSGGAGGPGSYVYPYIYGYAPYCVIQTRRGCILYSFQALYTFATAYTTGGTGGAGGEGGAGQGYNQTLQTGAAGAGGGAASGPGAGVGGPGGSGGDGGDWGQSGTSGLTGSTGANGNVAAGVAGVAGLGGGVAGYYIKGLSSYVTFTNTGIATGRTN